MSAKKDNPGWPPRLLLALLLLAALGSGCRQTAPEPAEERQREAAPAAEAEQPTEVS